MWSHAAIFWDDEMEPGNTGFSEAYMMSTMIPGGNMAYDTNVKFSGNGSVRLNYPPNCMAGASSGQQCGGSITRSFPAPTEDIYRRFYYRISGSGPNVTSNGLFQVSQLAFTKMVKGEGTPATNGLIPRLWWTMGCCGSKRFMITMERVPSPSQATNVFSSHTFADNRWYCVETHEKMNTSGQANGIAEAWIDGVKVVTKTDALWRNSEMDNATKWKEFSIVRQEGTGNVWFDRYAAGDTRIGCLNATSDTTRPAPPRELVIR
jgi:hypothetical protein